MLSLQMPLPAPRCSTLFLFLLHLTFQGDTSAARTQVLPPPLSVIPIPYLSSLEHFSLVDVLLLWVTIKSTLITKGRAEITLDHYRMRTVTSQTGRETRQRCSRLFFLCLQHWWWAKEDTVPWAGEWWLWEQLTSSWPLTCVGSAVPAVSL